MEFPDAFKEQIQSQLGNESVNFFSSLKKPASLAIRTNPLKSKVSSFKEEEVSWCSTGYYLSKRPSFTLDPLFHAGTYYVQEPSSMIIEQVFNQYLDTQEPLLVLDLCAAPGGKSTHFASLLNNKSLLIANEVIGSRAQILRENIIKWGTGNVIVTNNDPKDFARLTGLFDVIFIDAPCSGEGLFRKDEEAIKEWSHNLVKLCSDRQKRILNDIIGCLKPGGILIYSTCTFNPEENENNVEWLCNEYSLDCLELSLNAEWGIVESKTEKGIGYHLYPHKAKGEGFFLSVLRNSSFGEEIIIKPAKEKAFSPLGKDFSFVKTWIKENEERNLYTFKDTISLLPDRHLPLIEFFYKHLNVLYSGVTIGETKRMDVIPAHQLAMYTGLKPDSFPALDFSLEKTLDFLRRNDITLKEETTGWKLITYQQVPIGWVKNLGNRVNNYYPTEWRIRMK